MALEVYSRDNIARGIIAVVVAKLSTASHGQPRIEYCRGVLETAEAQALLYGVSWKDMKDYLGTVVSQDLWEALIL